jgi:hypothetical protein
MDIIVRHFGQFVPPASSTGGNVVAQDRLARLSGRDGHVIWDRALTDLLGVGTGKLPDFPHALADCNVYRYLEIFALVPLQVFGSTPCEWRAVSLRDGKALWSHAATYCVDRLPTFAAGDLEGDGRLELVVRDQIFRNARDQLTVTALDSRDGSTRWTWYAPGASGVVNQNPRNVCLGDFEGKGASYVCVTFLIGRPRWRRAINRASSE